jgi:hypothetical protein
LTIPETLDRYWAIGKLFEQCNGLTTITDHFGKDPAFTARTNSGSVSQFVVHTHDVPEPVGLTIHNVLGTVGSPT